VGAPTAARVIAVLVAGLAWLALAAPTQAHGVWPGPVPKDPLGIASAWHLDAPIMLGLFAAGAMYASAVGSVNEAHPGNPWPRRRSLYFALGVVAIGLALLSPLDTLSDDLLTVHMLQHLLLVTVAPPLLAASGVGTLALRAASRTTRDRYLLPFLHSRVVSILTFPVVGWLALPAVMWGSHLSQLYNLALVDDGIHAVEHLLYFVAASLFWWPLLSPDPLRWRLHPAAKAFAVLTQMPSMSFLAITIISSPTPLYPAYLGRSAAFGVDTLAEQQIAGSVMWLMGDITLLAAGVAVLVGWFRYEEEETKRVDARLDRARQLSRKEGP